MVEGGKNLNANLLPIQYNGPRVTLSHCLGVGVSEPTCAGRFILPGPNKARNIAVLDHKRDDLF